MRSFRIGETLIEVWDDTKTARITLPDGRQVMAAPQDNEEYRENARKHGYGDDTWAFCVDHEVGHVLLPHELLGAVSYVLRGVADHNDGTGTYWEHWWAEEAAVLGAQQYARMTGTSRTI